MVTLNTLGMCNGKVFFIYLKFATVLDQKNVLTLGLMGVDGRGGMNLKKKINTVHNRTVCPGSSGPFLYSNLQYKMGHYILDTQYYFFYCFHNYNWGGEG